MTVEKGFQPWTLQLLVVGLEQGVTEAAAVQDVVVEVVLVVVVHGVFDVVELLVVVHELELDDDEELEDVVVLLEVVDEVVDDTGGQPSLGIVELVYVQLYSMVYSLLPCHWPQFVA